MVAGADESDEGVLVVAIGINKLNKQTEQTEQNACLYSAREMNQSDSACEINQSDSGEARQRECLECHFKELNVCHLSNRCHKLVQLFISMFQDTHTQKLNAKRLVYIVVCSECWDNVRIK